MIFEDSKDLKNAGNPGNPFFKGNRRQPLLQCNGGMGMIRNDSSKMFQKLWGSFSHSYLSHPFASGHQVPDLGSRCLQTAPGLLGRCWIEIGERASFLRLEQVHKVRLSLVSSGITGDFPTFHCTLW